MIILPGVTIHSKIYESLASLVYRGIREQENCAVIAKVLKQDYPSSQELTRYRQEYEITHSLSIEGVVKAYSQQDYQRTLVILSEDFGGESLEYWMRQQSDFSPLPLSVFLDVAIAITNTLGKLHAAHVIHKDINPSNIVFNPNTGVVKLIDFGIATRFSRMNPTFKNLHLLEGTPAYLSPEQTGWMNRRLDYRTDFYSLGVTFYELLTGQLPFPTQDILELVHCHIARPPVPPHEVGGVGCGVWGVGEQGRQKAEGRKQEIGDRSQTDFPHTPIPKAVSDIVMKLMAKNAEDRYQSAWGIKADLERCAEQLAEVGRIEPMPLGLQDVSEQFCIPQKLYGRAVEIEALLAAFERVAGSEGVREMLLVSGYAGVGKTALVQELYKPIAAKHGYFIWGKFDQFRRNVPYSAIVDALQKLVQQLLGEPDEQMEVWRSRLLSALGSNGQIIIDVIPEVESIVGKQPPVPEVGATEAQNRFNLTFQRFVRVFCAKEHPLAIFLDDLQWIDAATLKLIELILLDEQIQYLFLIGAYRDNEVTPTHPLILTLESLRNQGAILQDIILTPLTLESLSQLLAETLHHTPETVHSLAKTVSCKTEGNPFFVGEFLKLLDGENLLTFDAQQLSWQWNLAEIEAQDITDNVVELLLRQLQKLPEATQQILSIAACVGSEFDLKTLAIVCKKSPKAISQDLLAAIQTGLIQPLSELDENLLVQEYKFLHDRVQQAAYALIDESQKQVVHLQIGRNLLGKTLPEQLSERLFEIVDHLNHGIELVSDRAKRNEIARLNLMAGQKAKGAIAYSTASNYLTTGRQWLEASSWQTNYDLTLALSVETTEVAYLCGEFEQAEYWAAIVLQEAKTVLETVKVYEVKIQIDLAQNQRLKAINTGLQVLQQLGINFPKTPSQSDICLELDTITALFKEKEVESLIDLPEMTEPSKLAAMQILSSITIAAQITVPNLIPLLAAKQVNLSIQYGNAFVSPFAYATFGLILCGAIGNIETGYQFGQLALNLLSQSHTHALKARTLLIVNDFIICWKKHIRELLQPLLEGYQIGLETGDLESAAYSAQTHCFQSYINGKKLVEVERDMVTYNEAIHHIKQETALTWNQIFRQAVINLMGGSIDSTRLIGESYNEEIELPQYEAANDGSTIFCVHFTKLYLCYLFSKYAQAVENAALAETYSIRFTGSTPEPLYYLYDSLARLATYSGSSTQVRSEILKKVAVSQEKMKHWADHAPMNYLHKYHLVEAETARVLGQLLEAEEFYEQAIQGAKDNEYLQEEALAYELTAKFYLERSRSKIAQTYMKEAHYCYERWGAMAKVKDLETRYPQFFPQSSDVTYTPIHATSGTTSARLDSAIDLAAVMKAAQALSEIIRLDRLIATLMQVAIENAGAETGALILLEDAQLTVVAQCSGGRQCDPEKLAVADCATIPVSVIHTVERTQATLVFDDAVSEASFSTDPYIQNRQTRSLLCMPILKQSQMIGILYLENNLSPGVFKRDRLQVLKLLMAQAAISLENARLYEQLADYAETLERKVEERTQALQRSETKFRNIFENSQVGIYRTRTCDGLILNANQRFANLLGFDSPEEIIGLEHTTGFNVNPNDRQKFIEVLKRDREVRSYEIQMRKRDGTPFWGLFSSYLNADDEYIEGVVEDISDRKQAEVALQTSEERLRLALTAANQGLYDTNIKTGEIVFNPEYALMFGYDPATLHATKNEWIESVHPDDRESVIAACHACLTGEVPNYQAEYRQRTQDGQWKWILSVGKVVTWNESGEPIRVLGVYTDIDDRKRAEAALQTSEERLRLALTAANHGLYDMNLKTEEIVVNPEYALMLGYDPATFHETPSRWAESLHPDDRESMIAVYDGFMTGEAPTYRAEYRLRTQDGQWKWILSVGEIVAWDESGKPMRALGIYTDIDVLKQAETVLRQSEAQFREQAILSAFRADVDSALAQSDSLPLMLHRCTEAVVKHLNAAFARIWTINKDQNVLELQASAGMYTRLDGTYSRVSMNSPKLGRIAQESFPLLINNVFDESFVDHEWAEREGIVAFAGYPILLDEQLVGVIAMFARQSIPVSHCEALGFAAREMALGIKRKQAEESLQASEAELRSLFSAIPDPLFVITAEGQVIEAVALPTVQLYQPLEEQIGKTLHQLFAQEQADEFLDYVQQVLRTQQVLTVEYSLWIAGRETWLSARIAPFRQGQVIWLARDITAHKQAQVASILEERNRMAREIHDTLAQAFTGILAQVGAANQVLTDDLEATQAHLDLIKELALTGLTEARRSVVALRPQLLEEGGLQSALHRLVAQLRTAAMDTTLYYEIEGAVYSLPTEVESNLLRIGQEALTNATRHAHADEIRVELVYDRDRVCLRVKDNGQGFGVGSIPSSEGFGLLGMSERAERIGAQLTIRSQPGQGTEIIVVIGV